MDRLLYIDRLKEAGVDDPVARAHVEALREAALETVATKADLTEAVQALNHRIESAARDLRIRGAGLLTIIAGLTVGLKLVG